MAERPSTRSSTRRRWVLVGAILGWVLIVVAGAGESTDDALLGVENLDVIWIVLGALLLVPGLVLLIYTNPFAGEWTPPEKRRRGQGLWVFLLVGALLWIWRPDFLQNLAEEDVLEELQAGLETEVDTTADEAAPEVVAQASDLFLIVVAIALLAGLWYFLRWRSQRGAIDEALLHQAMEADLEQALEQASHELAITGDPRTAVLRSYAVLETVLATHGFTRNRSETATEHMRRSLQHLRIESAPLVTLGSLYELARFSDNPVTAAQQDAAADALARARTSLGAPS